MKACKPLLWKCCGKREEGSFVVQFALQLVVVKRTESIILPYTIRVVVQFASKLLVFREFEDVTLLQTTFKSSYRYDGLLSLVSLVLWHFGFVRYVVLIVLHGAGLFGGRMRVRESYR